MSSGVREDCYNSKPKVLDGVTVHDRVSLWKNTGEMKAGRGMLLFCQSLTCCIHVVQYMC